MSSHFFDLYSLRARLLPALLALLPLFLATALWSPELYDFGTSLAGLAVACGLTVALAHFSRGRGRAVERRLVHDWGALPATLWLRHSDCTLDHETKARYRAYLEKNVPHWSAPTPAEELSSPDAADERNGSAVKWLIENTRDRRRFSLVFEENVSYGFRRNLLGLRPVGSAIAIAVTLWFAYRTYSGLSDPLNPGWREIAAIAMIVIITLWWTKVVTQRWVRDAADAYARALLAACDALASGR